MTQSLETAMRNKAWLARHIESLRGPDREVLARAVYTALRVPSDSEGAYSIDEVLGSAEIHALYQRALRAA